MLEDAWEAKYDRGVQVTCSEASDHGVEVDALGLDAMDRRYLRIICENYGGGPVGVETLAAALSEQRDAIEEVIEPFLIQQALVQRTPRGRVVTARGFEHIGLKADKEVISQLELIATEVSDMEPDDDHGDS